MGAAIIRAGRRVHAPLVTVIVLSNVQAGLRQGRILFSIMATSPAPDDALIAPPAPLTPLIGRERELALAIALLGRPGLRGGLLVLSRSFVSHLDLLLGMASRPAAQKRPDW